MKTVLYNAQQVAEMIGAGKRLLLAGDARLLETLPRGYWVGGSIPYFMAEQGGVQTSEHIYVTELPSYVKNVRISYYDQESVANVYQDMSRHGFSFILIPAFSATHSSFAINAPRYKDFASQPLVGWVSGVPLDQVGKRAPIVFDGTNARPYSEGAVVMHVELPPEKVAQLDILNIFQQGGGDVIEFLEDGFEAKEALINGRVQSLADYIGNNGMDLKLPLVADYAGALINTSFQSVDPSSRSVKFYAPVFRGAKYRQATQSGTYIDNFTRELGEKQGESMLFSCNCILNYVYAGLEGKRTGNVTGPITFGEIAYQLLNQTLVYLTISDA
jgi:hypothetical protein